MTGSRLLRMNPIIGKPFEGTALDGRHVSGIILHSGAVDKETQQSVTWVIACYPQNGRRHGGYAVVDAYAIQEHMAGLELVASTEADEG